MKREESKIERENIFASVFDDHSVDPRPSVSSKIASVSSLILIDLFHIQIPLVQACVVLPISNPQFLSKFNLLIQKSIA